MTTILGIDAAWTATRPSGVAVVSSTVGNWRLIGIVTLTPRRSACAILRHDPNHS